MLDIATISGFCLGISVLVAGFLLAKVPLIVLWNPEAWIIILGGTLTSLLIHYQPAQLLRAFNGLKSCFFQSNPSVYQGPGERVPELIIDDLKEIAGFIRKHGLLALHPVLDDIEHPFLRKGLTMVVDNTPPHILKENLSVEMELTHRAQMETAQVFDSAGGVAPTMGLIGALIGLMTVVHSFKNPEALGYAVAHAFGATLLGVALANLFLLPVAGKLRARARTEWFEKSMLMQGVLSIQAGDHPMQLEQKLTTYVDKPSLFGSMDLNRSIKSSYENVPDEDDSSGQLSQRKANVEEEEWVY
jgi:chemotaxis protein MotA